MQEVDLISIATWYLLEYTAEVTLEDLEADPTLVLEVAHKIRSWMDKHPARTKEFFLEAV